jgi:Type I restriction modification DNA specificity domain
MTRIDELFDVAYGNQFDMNKMVLADKQTSVAFVGRRGGGQGVSGFVAPIAGLPPYPAGLLTVALGGSYLLSSFVQQRPFYTAQNVAVLTPIDAYMPLAHRLFYTMCIRHNAFRYTAFGREANRTIGTIELPDAIPPWVDQTTMPTYEGLAASAGSPLPLSDPATWCEFALGSLFDIKKGTRLTKASRTPGTVRFIGASEKHNGVTDRNDLDPMFGGGQLTVAYNGNSVGWTFYQDKPFFASDDVNVLEPKAPVSVPALLFVAAIIMHGKSRYTYGYKWTLERMCATPIRLPGSPDGNPDWAYMDAFMRGLPFSALLAADARRPPPARREVE